MSVRFESTQRREPMSSYLNHVGVTVHGLVLAASASTTTTAAPKKSGSTSNELILFAVLGLIVYFLVLRPRTQRTRRMQQQKRTAEIGDEVMLTSGIIGRVTSIEGDRASIEIAPEIEVEVVTRAIGQVLSSADAELPVDVPPDPGADDEHDVYDGDEHDGYDAEGYADDEHDAADEARDGDEAGEHDAGDTAGEHESDAQHDDNDSPAKDTSSKAGDGLGVDGRKP